MTFGAPMVLYSRQAAQLYNRLQKMEAHAEQDAGNSHPPLQFHNFVNGAASWEWCPKTLEPYNHNLALRTVRDTARHMSSLSDRYSQSLKVAGSSQTNIAGESGPGV